jgi:hypothetical protein
MATGWGSAMVRLAYRGSGRSDPGEQAAYAQLVCRRPGVRTIDLTEQRLAADVPTRP